jgi:hypothetical protein
MGVMMFKFAEIPVIILAIGVLLVSFLLFFQIIFREEPVVCGHLWFPPPGGCEPTNYETRGWVSEPFRLGVNSRRDEAHDYNSVPVIVQVWSSSRENGP